MTPTDADRIDQAYRQLRFAREALRKGHVEAADAHIATARALLQLAGARPERRVAR
jgi:hypothetical protein